MKRSELITLRKLVQEETNRRERINKLLDNNIINEYLELTGTKQNLLNTDIKEVLKQILKKFKVTESNGIYVCTAAWYTTCDICYEEDSFTSHKVPIDSTDAESKTYSDIESGKYVYASKDGSPAFEIPSIKEFECRNIVLNPFNVSINRNGYDNVRMEFFETTLKYGQGKSKRMILEKYRRL